MDSIMTDLFLQTYFTYDSVIGKVANDAERLFDKLYSAFLLPDKDRGKKYALVQSKNVRDIETYEDYARLCRIKKYSDFSEINSNIGEEEWHAISIKGEVLRNVKQLGYADYSASTEISVCKFLTDTSDMGYIPSMCTLGFLLCEGVFVKKNMLLGQKYLNRAAQWNSKEGMLLSLFYDKNNRNLNLDRLYTVTKDTLFETVYSVAADAYGSKKSAIIPENQILKKAFSADLLKPYSYSPQHARLIFCNILSLKDKERALFSENKETVSEIADLPLKLTAEEIKADFAALNDFPLSRDDEKERICCALENADFRNDAFYRPLCLCGDDSIVKAYLSVTSRMFPSAHVEIIDVAELNDFDLEPTKNNVFVRSCNEDKQNVYLLRFKGEIHKSKLASVINFLQSDKRRRFNLQRPSAIIDLRAIIPICFCDKQNIKSIKPYCDTVELAPVTDTEKFDLLSIAMKERSKQYRIKSISVDDTAQNRLIQYSVEAAENLIDKAARRYRRTERLMITEDILNEVSNGETATKSIFGFGGVENESK